MSHLDEFNRAGGVVTEGNASLTNTFKTVSTIGGVASPGATSTGIVFGTSPKP